MFPTVATYLKNTVPWEGWPFCSSEIGRKPPRNLQKLFKNRQRQPTRFGAWTSASQATMFRSTSLDPLRYGKFVCADPLNYMMIKATGQQVNISLSLYIYIYLYIYISVAILAQVRNHFGPLFWPEISLVPRRERELL